MYAEIRKKQEETGGLLTEKAAARVLAAPKPPFAAVAARVERVYPPHKFSKNGREGVVRRVLLAPSSEKTPAALVLWNAQAALADALEKGDAITITGATAKKTAAGADELHSNPSTKITTAKSIPALGAPNAIVSFAEVKNGQEADFYARIKSVGARRVFEKNNARGAVARCTAEDGSGAELPLVLWDENADATSGMREGTIVKVEGGRAKTNNGVLEVHVHRTGRIIANPKNAPQRLTSPASAVPQAT